MEWLVGIAGVAGSIFIARTTAHLTTERQTRKIQEDHDNAMTRLREDQQHAIERLREDHRLAMAQLREELKLDYSIESALLHLLRHPNWGQRSLAAIKKRVRGFEDDENKLRMALLRAGAVAFDGKDEKREKVELWGLLERNWDRVT